MAHFPRCRHVRHRSLTRMNADSNRTVKFLAERASTLTSTASGKTFTVDHTSEIFTSNTHGLTTGNGPVVVSNSGGALPAGLVAGTLYWPIKIDANTFYLAATRKLALAGTAVAMTGNGTGTHTLKRATTSAAFLERLRAGSRPRTIMALTDVDTLA